MREPTPETELLAWWADALAGKRPPLHEDVYHCGFYKRRMVARGPFVPARIFVEREVCPDTGELLSDEVLRCEVNGQRRDITEEWLWISKFPISRDDFDDLTLMAEAMA